MLGELGEVFSNFHLVQVVGLKPLNFLDKTYARLKVVPGLFLKIGTATLNHYGVGTGNKLATLNPEQYPGSRYKEK